MRIVLQKVLRASVVVDGEIVGKIEKGILVFAGFEEEDTTDDFEWIAKKIIQLRIFEDDANVMNLDLQQIKGDILVVSQFTLHASTKKGNRPSYIKASKPDLALEQYNDFLAILEQKYKQIQKGIFGANMKVELVNDGPVTIFIDSKNKE